MSSSKAKAKGSSTSKDPITVKQIAEKLEVDPKELRVWLRAQGKGLGERGKRYEFTAKQAKDIEAKYKESKEAKEDTEADAS
jgi:phage antirepressor YoqD-like protein